MFTRQHYKAIAEIIREQKEHVRVFTGHMMAEAACKDIAAQLADYFAKDNPRFDREKFLNACGITD